ncbi:MAG: hypothetical protein N4A65_16635, partial [Cohaesibacter sp.]|nr:hypothetical protein [Cohaesibacter sp.]
MTKGEEQKIQSKAATAEEANAKDQEGNGQEGNRAPKDAATQDAAAKKGAVNDKADSKDATQEIDAEPTGAIAKSGEKGEKPDGAQQGQKEGQTAVAASALVKKANLSGDFIEKPEAGETKVVSVDQSDAIQFAFDLNGVNVHLSDVDLIIEFADGGKLILLEFGMHAVSDIAPTIQFEEFEITAQDLLAKVGEFKPSEVSQKMNFSTAQAEQQEQQDQQATPQEQAVEVVQVETVQNQSQNVGPGKFKIDAEEDRRSIEEKLANKKSDEDASSSQTSSSTSTSDASNVASTENPGILDLSAAELEIELFGITQQETTTLSDGTTRIYGATALPPADTDSSYPAQAAVETITGTAGNDLIYADSPTLAPMGASARMLEVKAIMPDTGWVPQSAKVTGLPEGFSVIGATEDSAGNFDVIIDPNKPLESQIQLQYALPEEGATPNDNGFESEFTLNIEYTVRNGSGDLGRTAGTAKFGIRQVNNASDAEHIDTVTGDEVYVLNSNPPGNIVNAGAGDDKIVAAVGTDNIDGGAGYDTLSYDTSRSGVTVDLQSGAASGGYASNDVFSNIEALEGSRFNDTLSGDGGDNRLTGGAGADTLDGRGGTDEADYSASNAGVTVDLEAGTGLGGHAAGDSLANIENVTGSDHDDTLIGDASANVLKGGEGDDTLVGKGGADRLEGGEGSDTADYSSSASAITINLDTNTAFGGDATGDVLVDIESIVGSSSDDVLIGDAESNNFQGGAGNDRLSGLGGADKLEGGAGDDILEGGEGADSLIGGAGSDTVSYASAQSAVTVNLGLGSGSGSDAQGDIYTEIENVEGSTFGDQLTGDDGANILDGGAGNDVLRGGAGADELRGGAGTDTVDYSSSSVGVSIDIANSLASGGDATGDTFSDIENVIGSEQNDSLLGDAGANELVGGAGNDVLTGREGGDRLVGGSGVDTADYSTSASAVTVNLGTATGSGGDADGDTYLSIENLSGSDHNDTLIGSASANRLSGGQGDDTLDGGDGADILDGGAGIDVADYSRSASSVTVNLQTQAGAGGSAEGDNLLNIENLQGSLYNDTLSGDDEVNVLRGDQGDDRLIGNGGNDTLEGDEGDDILVGGAGADVIRGGTGVDTVDYSQSGSSVTVNLTSQTASGGEADGDTISDIENVIGSAQDDILIGDAGANRLDGGAGNDTLTGRAGADALIGGSGVDTADYATSDAAVNVSLKNGTASGGHAEGDTLSTIERVVGSAHNDTLEGDDSANTLIGGDGNDTLSGLIGDDVLQGGDGDDTLAGGIGADTLEGGAGQDSLDYSQSSGAVTINLATNSASGGDADGDTFTDIENVIGSDGTDVLTGDASANTLRGNGGQDRLIGGAGDDSLFGDAGDDHLVGGAGADSLTGGLGADTADYSSSSAAISINLLAGTASGGDAQGDTLSEIENVTGSAHNDSLIGDSNSNILRGEAGDDTLIGGEGADQLIGNSGVDTADYSASLGAVNVQLDANIATGGDAQGDSFSGIENLIGSSGSDILIGDGSVNVLTGGEGSDTLRGRAGDDTLIGGDGNDILEGGAGSDSLQGGAGLDTIDYSSSADGVAIHLQNSTGVGGDADGDTYTSIENVIGSSRNDSLTGNASDNTLTGGAGQDDLHGLAGDDT